MSGQRLIYVGNLPFSVIWKDLKDLFSDSGSIIRADVAQVDGKSKGFGTILFSNSEEAENAIEAFNGYEWDGRKLVVRFDNSAGSGRGRSPGKSQASNDDNGAKTSTSVYVGNLPYNVSWQDLKDLFREAGTCIRTEVPTDYEGRSKGFGTVVMTNTDEANSAIQMFNGYEWNGRKIFVREDQKGGSFGFQNRPTSPNRGFQQRGNSPKRGFQQREFKPRQQATNYNNTTTATPASSSATPNTTTTTNPIAGRQLFVGNLPFSFQWRDLKDLCEPFGKVVRSDIAMNGTGKSRGFGEVVFENAADATVCIAELNGTLINNREIEVREDKFTNESNNLPGCQVFVDGIPFEYQWQQLKDLFHSYELSPVYAECLRDQTGRPRGSGIVRFDSPSDGELAVQFVNGANVNGRTILVKLDKFAPV